MKTYILCCLLWTLCKATTSLPHSVKLTALEEECIKETGVSLDAVLQDKVDYPVPEKPVFDPNFSKYIDCYGDKLDKAGKLFYTKDTSVEIPGYRTRKPLPGVYCTEDELTGKVPMVRQCAIPGGWAHHGNINRKSKSRLSFNPFIQHKPNTND